MKFMGACHIRKTPHLYICSFHFECSGTGFSKFLGDLGNPHSIERLDFKMRPSIRKRQRNKEEFRGAKF